MCRCEIGRMGVRRRDVLMILELCAVSASVAVEKEMKRWI